MLRNPSRTLEPGAKVVPPGASGRRLHRHVGAPRSGAVGALPRDLGLDSTGPPLAPPRAGPPDPVDLAPAHDVAEQRQGRGGAGDCDIAGFAVMLRRCSYAGMNGS